MKVHCDKAHDILFPAFKDGPSNEIVESSPNVIMKLDENKEIAGALRSGAARKQALSRLLRLPRALNREP